MFHNHNTHITADNFFFRVHGLGKTSPCSGHPPGGVQKQEMGLQLVRVSPGTHYVQVLGAMCGPSEVTHCQRGLISIQEHVSICECWVA